MLVVWGRKNSINVQKVMWVIGELGLEYQRKDVGGPFGGLDSSEYGKLNPNRLIPTLVDEDGTAIWESHTIVRYLAARYGSGTLWPSDPTTRALSDRWLDWKISSLLPNLAPVFLGLIRTPQAKRDMTKITLAAAAMGQTWTILDVHLKDKRFIASDELTIGDIAVGAACYRYNALDIERPKLPNVTDWYKRLKARESFRTHVMIPLS